MTKVANILNKIVKIIRAKLKKKGVELTPEEKAYIVNDILSVKEAYEIMCNEVCRK